MKTLTKSLAALLALLLAFGISASAAELPDDLDSLPAITVSEVTAGTLTGDALWYRFTPKKTGFHFVTVTGNGITCNEYVEGSDPRQYTSADEEMGNFYVKGETAYFEVLGTGDFSILIEPVSTWEMFKLFAGLLTAGTGAMTGIFAMLSLVFAPWAAPFLFVAFLLMLPLLKILEKIGLFS